MRQISLLYIATLVERIGSVLFGVALLVFIAGLVLALDGGLVPIFALGLYALGIGTAGVMIIAFGKLIIVLLDIQENTRNISVALTENSARIDN